MTKRHTPALAIAIAFIGAIFGQAVASAQTPAQSPAQTAGQPPVAPICLIGIVTVTHGQIGHDMAEVAQHVVGEQDKLASISVDANDDPEERRQALLGAIEETDSGCGVIIFSDMFGGTPSNIAISAMIQDRVEVVAGLNLPMLVRALALRASNDVLTTTQGAENAGRRYINRAASLLRRQSDQPAPAAPSP